MLKKRIQLQRSVPIQPETSDMLTKFRRNAPAGSRVCSWTQAVLEAAPRSAAPGGGIVNLYVAPKSVRHLANCIRHLDTPRFFVSSIPNLEQPVLTCIDADFSE